jgi:hypothetical protein
VIRLLALHDEPDSFLEHLPDLLAIARDDTQFAGTPSAQRRSLESRNAGVHVTRGSVRGDALSDLVEVRTRGMSTTAIATSIRVGGPLAYHLEITHHSKEVILCTNLPD